MGLAIRKVLARRPNGAKSCSSHSRNGDTSSDGGLCACCRDRFPVGGDGGHALVDCLVPPFSFFLGLLRVGRGNLRSLAGWDDGDLEGLGAGISVPPSWDKCYGVCSAIEGNAQRWMRGRAEPRKNEVDAGA